eukprot:2463765-Pyramimonas_sp.AAC.1
MADACFVAPRLGPGRYRQTARGAGGPSIQAVVLSPTADTLDAVLAEKTRRSARGLVLKRQRALKRVRVIGGV